MASLSKGESSEDDLYGDIDDMYVSQSETESVHKSEDTLISDTQNSSKQDEMSQEDPVMEDGANMNDLDLYDDLIAEEDLQKVNSYQEMMKKFEEAMKMVQQLESENKKLRESLNKTETSSKDIQKNFSSLLITAKGEINRKDKELNTLRKQLTNKQKTPGRYRNQRGTTTEASSFTSLDSDFDPLCVSSPGRQNWQRYGDKSPKNYSIDTEKHSRSVDDCTDRGKKEYEKSVGKYDSRRSQSKDKEERSRSKIRTKDVRKDRKDRRNDSDKDRRNDSDKDRRKDSDKARRKDSDKDRRNEIDKDKRNNCDKDRRNYSDEDRRNDSDKDRRDDVGKDRTNKSDKDERRRKPYKGDNDGKVEQTKSSKRYIENEIDVNSPDISKRKNERKLKSEMFERDSKGEEKAREGRQRIASGDQVMCNNERGDRSVILNVNKKYTNAESKQNDKCSKKTDCSEGDEKSGISDSGNKPKVLDLREKLRLKRISEDKSETISKSWSSVTSLSKSSEGEKIDMFQVLGSNDPDMENSCKTLPNYDSRSFEKDSSKRITKKIKENLNAEKEFLEQLKKSIKKNELASSKLTSYTYLEKGKVNDKEIGQKKLNREVISYSDASNEVCDVENITDSEKTILSEKYLTASPDMSESNETLNEDAYGAFSVDDMDSDNKDKDKTCVLNEEEGKFDNEIKEMEVREGSSDRIALECSISGDNHNKDSRSISTDITIKSTGNEKTEYGENNSKCDNIQNNDYEPMEIQSTTNSVVNTESQIPYNFCENEDKMDLNQTDSKFDKEFEPKGESLNVSPNVSNSSKNEATPDSARRRSARLLSKSESSNSGKTYQDTEVVCTAKAVANKISEERVETNREMTSAEKNNSRNLQRLDSRTGKRKRIRRSVTSETISCITSVTDSDIFNSVSDEAGDLSMSTDDTENSEDTLSSESSGKLKSLVCTDKNCSIKMRHLHPKCVDNKTKSPESLKENYINKDNKINQSTNDRVKDDTDKIDVDDKELNTLTCLNATERLKSIDVDSKLQHIHSRNKDNVGGGTIEITAEESADDSESSSSYSSSGSCFSSSGSCSSESSDSESESNFSDIKDENNLVRSDNKIIQSSELVKPIECSNSELLNGPGKSTHIVLDNDDDKNQKIPNEIGNDIDPKEGEKECEELKTIDNTSQQLTSMDNASEGKLELFSSLKETCEYKVNGSDILSETHQRKIVEDESGITDSVCLDKEAVKVLQIDDTSKRKSLKLIGADLKNNVSVTESVHNKNKENLKQDSDHLEQNLKEKTVNNNPPSLNVEAVESNCIDQTTGLSTEIPEKGERTEILDLENGNGKETKRNATEASENESDGSFGSNIMSERTDSLHSGDESDFSDSDDSYSSYSGNSTSSSDESGTGSAWETYSSDPDSEENKDRAKELLKNNERKPLNQERKDTNTGDIINKEVNADSVKENVVEMKDVSKAESNNTPMEIDGSKDNEMMTDTGVDKYSDLNKEISNDIEMGTDDERAISIEQCPNNSEKPNILELKSPEKMKTAKKTIGISPDRSHMLQCLLNCIQNVVQNDKSLIEKFNNEENKTQLDTYENLKENQSNEDLCSEPVANNVQIENASINENIESCKTKSLYTGNSEYPVSKEAGIGKHVEVVDKAQVLENRGNDRKKSQEKMIVDNESEGNNFDADFSSSDESSSGDSGSSSGSTHPTDCSTCSSSSESSSDSETETDEELKHEDTCGKGVTGSYFDVNCKLNSADKIIDFEDLKSKDKTVHSTEKRNETSRGTENRNDTMEESVTDLNERPARLCKNNPYWIADELPDFLQQENSTEMSDKDKSNDNEKISNVSPRAESLRPVTPAVKFANLSPISKGQKIDTIPEVQVNAQKDLKKVKNSAVGIIPSVVQIEKELVKDGTERSKNIDAKISKTDHFKNSEVNSNMHDEREISKSESYLKTVNFETSEKMMNTTHTSKPNDKPNKSKLGEADTGRKSVCGTKPSETPKSPKQKSTKPVIKPVEKNNGTKKKETRKVSDKERYKEPIVISKRQQIEDRKNIEKQDLKIVSPPLRRSPRKKSSQMSVTDTKKNETSKTGKKKPLPAKTSDETNLRKEKSNSKMIFNKSEDKKIVNRKTMEASKLERTIEKDKKNNRDKASSLSQRSSSKPSENVDKEDASIDAKRNDKKHGKNDISDVNEMSESSLFEEGIKLAEHKVSVDSKRDRKNSGSQPLANPKERNSVKSKFRDTTRELTEKIMKLKVEQNMLKNEIAEKQRKESDSLKLKLTIPKPHDSKLKKDTKENIKGKAPDKVLSRSSKTQPLRVAMATNGHEEMKSKTGTSKTGALNKNENLTFEEKLGDYEGYLSKSKSISKLKKRNDADPSLSLTVQHASLKTFTIPKLPNVRENHKDRKKDVTKCKRESLVSQKRLMPCSSRSENSYMESKESCNTFNRSSDLKSDNFKKSKLQSKSDKRFIVSESDSSISDSESEKETDSSDVECSDTMVKDLFGSSDSSGNSKKSITLADLRKTRSSEDTDDIVKDSTREATINPKEYGVLDKRKAMNFISCNESGSAIDKANCIKSPPDRKKLKSTVDKELLVNEPLVKKDGEEIEQVNHVGKESKQVNYVLRTSSEDVNKSPVSSGNKVEKNKTITTNKKECVSKTSHKVIIHHIGSKKSYSKTKDCEMSITKEKYKDHDKVNTKSYEGQNEDNARKKLISPETVKERERKLKVHSSSSELALRKSPRIKARSPVNSCEDSRDEAGFKGLRRSNRTPLKSDKSGYDSKNEVRYFELSDKNPILSKIISPKKPKLHLDICDNKKQCKENKSNSKVFRKHTEKETENESKGVPILLLEENTMDGIDYHDDVTLDIGSGSQCSENNANDEDNSDDASGENSDTDLSVEDGELSDSEEDDDKVAIESMEEPLKKSIEVTPKKQKISLSECSSGRNRISPVTFLPGSTTSCDGDSSCKCSKRDCIHTRLSLNDLSQCKRYKSDSDSASDSTVLRQRRRPDHPSVRNRSRDKEDRLRVQRREKFDRKSPNRLHRRSPPRRRPRSRSRSTSPKRERRKRSRSPTPKKSRFCRKHKVSRYKTDSGTDSPRPRRRNRHGSRERSESPDRYHSRRKTQSFRDSNSESTVDVQENRYKEKTHYLEKRSKKLSSEKCRDNERDNRNCIDDNFDETSDEESRFSKLKPEKMRDSVKGKQLIEFHPESRRIRNNERRNFRKNSDYSKSRRRSRSPHCYRRKKRLRSDSESDMSEKCGVKDKRSVCDKYKDTDSPSHKRSRSEKSGIDNSNEYSDRSRKR